LCFCVFLCFFPEVSRIINNTCSNKNKLKEDLKKRNKLLRAFSPLGIT